MRRLPVEPSSNGHKGHQVQVDFSFGFSGSSAPIHRNAIESRRLNA
jgi:hypothetical protein